MIGVDLQRLGVLPTLPDGGEHRRAEGAPAGSMGPGKSRTAGQIETVEDQELASSLGWLIRLRWMAGGGLVLATAIASRAGLSLAELPLYVTGLIILAYNAAFRFVPGWRPDQALASPVARQWFARVQIGADWLATAVLIHYTGGIESPAVVFYLLHITIASLLLPHDRALLYVALAPALVGGVALAEYKGWLPHVAFIGPTVEHADAGFVIAALCFFTGAAYAMAICAMSISRRLRRREHEIAGLYESVRLSTSTLDLSLVLERLTEAAVKALRCQAASIRLLDSTGRRVDMVATHGLSDTYQGKAPMDLGKALVDREVLTGKVVLVADVAADPRVYNPQAVMDEGIRSMLCAPLMGKRGAIGVLRAYGAEGHEFTPDDGAFLAALAVHGAVAIE
ncbi:MAG: GAF domain-containing protein, partial [Acidobacteria bacterium]